MKIIEATQNTPTVIVDDEIKVLQISGNCNSTDKEILFKIIELIEELIEKNKEIYLELYLNKINTSTVKALFNLFKILKDYQSNGNNVKITWNIPSSNEDFIEIATDISDIYGIKINTWILDF